MTIKLGPPPTYGSGDTRPGAADRWRQLHPDPVPTPQRRRQHAEGEFAPSRGGGAETPSSVLGGLSALVGGLAGGIAAVILIHHWLSFTTTSTIIAHYAAFIVGAVIGGIVGYWLRYVLLIACLAWIGWIIYGVFHG